MSECWRRSLSGTRCRRHRDRRRGGSGQCHRDAGATRERQRGSRGIGEGLAWGIGPASGEKNGLAGLPVRELAIANIILGSDAIFCSGHQACDDHRLAGHANSGASRVPGDRQTARRTHRGCHARRVTYTRLGGRNGVLPLNRHGIRSGRRDPNVIDIGFRLAGHKS